MVKILSVDDRPIAKLPYRFASKEREVSIGSLDILTGVVDCLPKDLDCLVVTSDLQARENSGDRLLGEVVPEVLENIFLQLCLKPVNAGVILAGDFYTTQDLSTRGGLGDVRSVWCAFDSKFKWVTGVAGNHDSFGDSKTAALQFRKTPNINLLDGDSARVDDFLICGIGGIIGNASKPMRRSDIEFTKLLKQLLENRPDIFISHLGPNVSNMKLNGDASIRRELARYKHPLLYICGHNHWKNQAFAQLSKHVQILNVDMRVVVLQRESD